MPVIVFVVNEIDLFVSVSVVALPTNVSVAAGSVKVVLPAVAVALSIVLPDVDPFKVNLSALIYWLYSIAFNDVPPNVEFALS